MSLPRPTLHHRELLIVDVAGSDPYPEFNYEMLKLVVRADFIGATGLAYRENVRLSEDSLYLVEFFAADGTRILLARPLYDSCARAGARIN